MNCSGCGADLFSGQRFCNQCGRAADAQFNEPPLQGMPPSAVGPDRIDSGPPQYGPPGGTDPSQWNTPPAPGQPGQFPQYPPANYWAPPPVYQPVPTQPGYGAPYPVPSAPRTNQTAVIALVLSIVGLVCFGIIVEPIAIFLAFKAKKEIAADPLQTGGGMATGALIIGIIAGLLYIGLLILVVVNIVFSGGFR